ncbi:MAG TPA: hypothetical protein VLH80_07470 [Nitrospiraceae bacterium]|nr:hypothetical protein [Nitrospiraceae bacterium]
MTIKRHSLAAPDIQFGDPKLDRLMQFVRTLAAEAQALQQMLRSGNTGQMLLKNSTNDYDASWETGGGGTITGAENVGDGAGVFKDIEGALLAFKTLIAGSNIDFSVDSNSITISASGGGSGSGTVTSIGINSADLKVTGSPITTHGSIELEINTNVVTYAKMQQTSTDAVVLGRKSGDGIGNVEELAASDLAAIIGTSGYPKQLAYAGIV